MWAWFCIALKAKLSILLFLCKVKLRFSIFSVFMFCTKIGVFYVPTILKRIELRIIELGMTKTEFYEKSGISSATYSQWNTNTFQPSKRKLMAAASALKMTYEELVGEETTIEQKEIPPTEKVDGISKKDISLIKWFHSLPPETRKAILTLGGGPEDLAD